MSESKLKTGLLKGESRKENPYYIHGYRNQTSTSIKWILANVCGPNEIVKVSVAYSGLYYLHTPEGWVQTSDSETCDREHGLPPDGRMFLPEEDIARLID
jgi:hypothetical protein